MLRLWEDRLEAGFWIACHLRNLPNCTDGRIQAHPRRASWTDRPPAAWGSPYVVRVLGHYAVIAGCGLVRLRKV